MSTPDIATREGHAVLRGYMGNAAASLDREVDRPGEIRMPMLIPMRSIPLALFSFEGLIAVYMFAGIYKSDPRLAGLPFDMTLAAFAASVGVGLFILVRRPIYIASLPVVAAAALLICWLSLALGWSPSRIYGPAKMVELATLAFWALASTAIIVAPSVERTSRLFACFVLLSIWPAVESLTVLFERGGTGMQISVMGANYLLVGRLVGIAALISIAAWLYGHGPARLLWLALFAVLALVLAIGGGRGPLVATVIPVLALGLLAVRFTRKRILYWPGSIAMVALLLSVGTGIVGYAAATDQRFSSLARFERLLEGNFAGSAGARVSGPASSFEFAAQSPLVGRGLGSWPMLRYGVDLPWHPHNIFAELLVDGGIIAVLLFVAVLGGALRGFTLERLRGDPQAACAFLLFANTFLNAMVTEDIPGNRALFMCLGLMAMFAVRREGAR